MFYRISKERRRLARSPSTPVLQEGSVICWGLRSRNLSRRLMELWRQVHIVMVLNIGRIWYSILTGSYAICMANGHGKQTKWKPILTLLCARPLLKLGFLRNNLNPSFQGITLTPDNRAVIRTRVEIELEKLSGLGMEWRLTIPTIKMVQIIKTLFVNKHVFYTDSRTWNFMQRMHK